MTKGVQTDMSIISDSTRGFMDVQGPSMPCQNGGQSMLGMHELPAPQGSHRESMSTKSSRSHNPRKLLLTLPPHQIPENGCSQIRSWFLYLDSAVNVKPMKEGQGKYTIIFKDINAAHKALEEFTQLGYNIRKKYRPRPSPTKPLKFIVMASKLEVREGKTLKNDSLKNNRKVGEVKQGEVVIVNQVKGLRARIMKDGENFGWVSQFSRDDGIPQLELVEH